jgi:hypothetical protein
VNAGAAKARGRQAGYRPAEAQAHETERPWLQRPQSTAEAASDTRFKTKRVVDAARESAVPVAPAPGGYSALVSGSALRVR